MEERLPQRDAYVGRSLARFCAGQGLETSAVAEVLEAFVVSGLSGRAPSTKGSYRSVLRRIGHCQRPELATAFGASPARAPYSSAERAELAFVATAQRPAWRRASALGLLALGVGAGLRAGELVGVVGTDVVAEDRGVMVHVAGTRARVVLMDAGYAEVVSGLAERSGGGHLFCPGGADRSYKNFVNNFASGLVAGPGAPRLSSGRCRSSFICDHLRAGTALGEVLYLAGITEVESLLRYARHVEGAPRSKAELRAKLLAAR
jgi:integrase